MTSTRTSLPCRSACFNGAAAFRLRKSQQVSAGRQLQVALLQWGRSLSTAEIVAERPTVLQIAALQWGRSLSTAEMMPTRLRDVYRRLRFNGAAAFRLRKFDPLLAHPLVAACASMGPQPFDCGNAHKVAADHRRAIDFNGAAAFRLRKCDPGAVAGRFRASTSMGPQPFDCGNTTSKSPVSLSALRTSMGPQPFDCGNEPPDQRGELADRTSMGPQPFDCGNASFLRSFR